MSSLLSFLPRDKQHEPSSAPLPKDQDSTAARPMSLNLADSDGAVESSCTGDLSPGPSSAPPDMQWSPTGLPVEIKGDKKASENAQYEADSFNVSQPKTVESDTPTMLPAAETSREVEAVQITTEPSLPPPSLTLTGGFNGLSGRRQAPRKLPLREDAPYSIRPQLARVGLHHIMSPDMPQTPSLLSPRAAEFTASPFHRTAAGDLAGSSVFEQARISPKAKEDDPRSPAPMGEAPITRSIFDMF
ncbi:hypothetical protein MMC12_008660 [Toensbergia leucococca]|nr:hypothetical protein [Toensbergia leucococca]